MAEETRSMEVMGSLEKAAGRSRDILFRPFDLWKWLSMGVTIFIATMFSGGFGGGWGGGGGWGRGMRGAGPAARDGAGWAMANAALVAAVVLIVLLVALVLGLLLAWLRSRGDMMFIHAVAEDDIRIGENWRRSRELAWSLFLFRVVLGLVSSLLFLGCLAATAALTLPSLAAGAGPAVLVIIVPAVVTMIAVAIVFGVISALLKAFVAPLMYHFNLPCTRAWDRFRAVAAGNGLAILGFLLLRFVYYIVFGLVSTLLGCLTCCVGFLPVIHHTLFAPFYVFDRAFSLYMLQSLGPEYDMLRPLGATNRGVPPAPEGSPVA